MKFQDALSSLLQGKSLARPASKALFQELFQEKLAFAQAKTLLLLLARKGETPDEVLGCLDALKLFEPKKNLGIPHLIDTCGTGGDGSHSINVSTLAALVIAGAGGKVAKHGNRALSSRCGSSDLMEALGVNINTSPEKMIRSINSSDIGYFHAPLYHPTFSKMQPLRRLLKVRTIFNLLGPLSNPFKLSGQVIGVARAKYVPLFAKILSRQNLSCALVAHGTDGLDELSISAPSQLAWIRKNKISYEILTPEKTGLKRSKSPQIKIKSLTQSKKMALDFLQGKLQGSIRDMILLNAAAGLVVAGKAGTLREGVWVATQSVSQGKAFQAYLQLKAISN